MRRLLITALAFLGIVALAGPNMARYAMTRGSAAATADVGWDDPYTNNLMLRQVFATDAVTDTSGQGNNGARGAMVWEVTGTNTDSSVANFGRVKYQMHFDGIDDYSEIPYASSINPTGAITVAIWVNFDDVAGDGIVIGLDDWPANRAYSVFMNPLAYRLTGSVNGDSGRWMTDVLSTSQWYHCVMTVNCASSNYVAYFNGINYTSDTAVVFSSINQVAATHGLCLGVSYAAANWFDGKLADVRIYNTSLSATAVSNLWYFTGGKYTNQPWMSNENGY